MIEWLYRASIESSLIILAIIVFSPVVRRVFNAQIAYILWMMPVMAIALWKKPERPEIIVEAIGLPGGGVSLSVAPNFQGFSETTLQLLLSLWLGGMIIWSLIRFADWKKMHTILHSASHPLDKNTISTELQVKRATYFLTDLPSAPFVTGLIQPRIYLPHNFFEKYSPTHQKWILTHELTHIARGDLFSQLAAELIRACFWFNPIMHFAWRHFREDQELACDYCAIKNCNTHERMQYGQAMLQGMSANLLPATLAFFTLKKERFIMLQKHKKSKLRNIFGLLSCFAIAITILTEAPKSIAKQEYDESELLSIAFKDIPLNKVSQLLIDFNPIQISGMDLIQNSDIKITVEMEKVPQIETLQYLLNCSGFDLENDNESYTIVEAELEIADSYECKQMLGG